MFRYERDGKEFVDEFARFMVGRKVNQANGESNDEVDSECGCCFGAHLARFFVEDGRDLHDVCVEEASDNWRNNFDPSQWVSRIDEWRESYLDFARHETKDKDVDDDDLLDDEDLIDVWMELRCGDYNFDSYSYYDGATYLSEFMNLDRPQLERAFRRIMSYFAFNGAMGSDVFGGQVWESKNQAEVLRMSMIAWEVVCEKLHENFTSLDQFAHDSEEIVERINDLMPKIMARREQYSERI